MESLVEQVIGAGYEVSNALGAGFLEKVYERALLHELCLRGLRAEAQVPYKISYKGLQIGDYFADLLVESKVIIEVKCVDTFCNEHLAQCLNYLHASGCKIALLMNFSKPRMQWKRVVLNL